MENPIKMDDLGVPLYDSENGGSPSHHGFTKMVELLGGFGAPP